MNVGSTVLEIQCGNSMWRGQMRIPVQPSPGSEHGNQPSSQQRLTPGLQCYWLLWRDVLLTTYLLFLLL